MLRSRRGRRPRRVMAARLSVCLTFDFDALSPWAFEMAGGNVAALSRGEFGAVAVPRILALLERRGIPATFFVPGHTALAYPELVREIRDAGHELGHHGWVHEPLSQLEPDRERELLRRGLDALDRVAGVRPLGYRAPSVDVSAATVEILVEHGFLYDASFSGSDFEPYYLRTGDAFPGRRRVRVRRDHRPRRDPVLMAAERLPVLRVRSRRDRTAGSAVDRLRDLARRARMGARQRPRRRLRPVHASAGDRQRPETRHGRAADRRRRGPGRSRLRAAGRLSPPAGGASIRSPSGFGSARSTRADRHYRAGTPNRRLRAAATST